MAHPIQFGRRTGPQHSIRPAGSEIPAAKAGLFPTITPVPASPSLSEIGQISAAPVDHELQEWKKARRRSFRLPWRQLSLLASLCFGVASLVLPDTVNENVDWLLYALMAASFYAGISARLRKAVS